MAILGITDLIIYVRYFGYFSRKPRVINSRLQSLELIGHAHRKPVCGDNIDPMKKENQELSFKLRFASSSKFKRTKRRTQQII